MRDVFAVIGAALSLAMLGLLAFAVVLMSASASRDRREKRELDAALERQRARAAARSAAEAHALHKWHAAQRGRIHHPLQHPVSYATVDELMPRVVSEAAADGR